MAGAEASFKEYKDLHPFKGYHYFTPYFILRSLASGIRWNGLKFFIHSPSVNPICPQQIRLFRDGFHVQAAFGIQANYKWDEIKKIKKVRFGFLFLLKRARGAKKKEMGMVKPDIFIQDTLDQFEAFIREVRWVAPKLEWKRSRWIRMESFTVDFLILLLFLCVLGFILWLIWYFESYFTLRRRVFGP